MQVVIYLILGIIVVRLFNLMVDSSNEAFVQGLKHYQNANIEYIDLKNIIYIPEALYIVCTYLTKGLIHRLN